MYKLTYPKENFDELMIDKNIILRLIGKHEAMSEKLNTNMRYYLGEHSIKERTMTAGVPNNKVVCNHAKEITDTATGYFMGNAISYKNTADADLEPLLVAFDDAQVDDTDSDNALNMSVYGVAYEYVYVEDGTTTLRTKSLEPEHTFMVVDSSIEEKELFACYYYLIKDDIYDKYCYVAYIMTEHYLYRLVIENNTTLVQATIEQPIVHNFGEVPVIVYDNNKYQIGDFEQQIPLIDAYNKLTSDRVNDKEQFIDAILALYGVSLGDGDEGTQAAKRLRQLKLLELPEDAKAEYLTRQMDENGAEVLRKALKEDIYTFSHVPNLTDENFAGNSSGVAMEYKLLGLEMITKTKERYYRKGLRKRIKLFCNFLGLKNISVEATSIIPVFSRSLPKNLLELAQIVGNLKGTVSQKTLLTLLPFVEDVDNEIEELEEEKQDGMEEQQKIFGQTSNDEPTGGEVAVGEDEE